MVTSLPKYLRYAVWSIGVLAALVALAGIAWDALGVTKPSIAAYCDTAGFVERTYSSFDECQSGLAPDIAKYGHVCGCRRADGIAGVVSKLARWVL
jgi:hypothetical protein